MDHTVKVFVSPVNNDSEFLDSVATESTGNEEVCAEKEEDVVEQELQELDTASGQPAEGNNEDDDDEVFRDAENIANNNSVNTEKDNNAKSSSAMVNVARTLQLASSWLNRTRAKSRERAQRVDSFLEKLEMAGPSHGTRNKNMVDSSASSIVIDPSRSFHYYWLIVVSISVLYNWIFIIARSAFADLQSSSVSLWLVLDYLSDVIYVVDMVIQFKTGKWVLR